jgi:hypothetical protein
MVRRFAMLARACERFVVKSNKLSTRDADTLASVGFGAKIFRDSPVWLKFFCAQVIEFIKHERKLLPQHLKNKVPLLYATGDKADVEADGVYGLRLQNLAITIDRVLCFLRRHPDHRVAPLIPHTDLEAANKLVFDVNSIWSTLKEFVGARDRTLPGLKTALEKIMERYGKNKPSIETAREILRRTAKALRDASPAYSPCADVLDVRFIIPPFFFEDAVLHDSIRT